MKLVFMHDCTKYALNYKVINFPSGEMTVRFSTESRLPVESGERRLLLAIGVMTPADVFIVQAARQYIETETLAKGLDLMCPYYPSARQDRVATEGDVNMLKVYHAALSAGFNNVFTCDAHSLASETLVDKSFSVCHMLADAPEPRARGLVQAIATGFYTLVAPDNGALKRVEQVAKRFGNAPVVYGLKHRDPVDGKITSYEIVGDVKDRPCLIIDDICDGGRTFTECAAKLREGGATVVSLFVTHGLFTKGVDALLDNGIDYLYTTNSTGVDIPEGYEERVSVICNV